MSEPERRDPNASPCPYGLQPELVEAIHSLCQRALEKNGGPDSTGSEALENVYVAVLDEVGKRRVYGSHPTLENIRSVVKRKVKSAKRTKRRATAHASKRIYGIEELIADPSGSFEEQLINTMVVVELAEKAIKAVKRWPVDYRKIFFLGLQPRSVVVEIVEKLSILSRPEIAEMLGMSIESLDELAEKCSTSSTVLAKELHLTKRQLKTKVDRVLYALQRLARTAEIGKELANVLGYACC